MAELKTKPNSESVEDFLNKVGDARAREDAFALLKLMREATKSEPVMWGSSMVGFGRYHYIYESGQEGDWLLTGFSPRKQNLTVYIMPGVGQFPELLKTLGKYSTGKSCLYFKRLDDIHIPTLKKLIQAGIRRMAGIQREMKAKRKNR